MIAGKPIPNKHTNDNQVQTILEASSTEAFNNNGNADLNIGTDTFVDIDISDLAYLSPNAVHHETHDIPSLHENLFQDSVRNDNVNS